MTYLLDTNICIYLIRQKPPQVFEHLSSKDIGEVAISSITLSELEYGVQKSSWPEKNKIALTQFLTPIEIIEYDDSAAMQYGAIRAHLEKSGNIIGPLDMLIAAHALSLGCTLVTNNTKEFIRVPGLRIEDWV